ncbi:hypothetical protein [Holophaga foetida]|uniref:hypothetical protein n=1 Tax=Holophaga foetida TaxID=35839 RepID=UPI000479B19B|nr:hypothetical protein [Holophaga foetida]
MPLVLTAAPLPWAEGARRILEAYETGSPMPELSLSRRDQSHRKWLEAAASQALPGNPYPRQSRAWKEAEAVRQFLSSSPDVGALQGLPLTLEGSRMALWRWGQGKVRRGEVDPGFRKAWEDRLMGGPMDLLHFFATRHALCFSLAEADQQRFQEIQEGAPKEYEEVLRMFQRTFPLLGGPCPPLRVWSLPALESQELPINELGPKGAWIAPLADFPTPPPEGWAWILPTPSGAQSAQEGSLEDTSRREGEAMLQRLGKHTAYLAPSAGELEAILPTFFPIRLEFGEDGLIRRILVGDAARVATKP